MTAFQAYNGLYNGSIVPLLTQHKDVEAVMLDAEAKGHLDAEVTHHSTASHAWHTQLAVLSNLTWQACEFALLPDFLPSQVQYAMELHRQHTTTDFDTYMQELNTLQGQRIELQDKVTQLQTCMNLLEEKRAWQDDQDLMALVQQLQAVLQVGSCRAVHHTIVLQVVILALHVCLLHVSF